MTVRIEVTPDDIRLGQRGQPDSCAIALAIRRKLPTCEVSVVGRHVLIADITVAVLPREAVIWMACFDGGAEIPPFSFELTLAITP